MSEIIIALSVMFVTAAVLLVIANQLGLATIPFYIIAGLIAGVFLEQPALIELAQWGIAFLVFVFGIRVDFEDIQSVFRDAEVAALGQLLVVGSVAFAIGYVCSLSVGFEDPVRNGLYFAAAGSFSSTIVGGGLLEQDVRSTLVHSRLASSLHFFDDIVAILVILILSVETLSDATMITSNIGYGVLFLLTGLVIYRHLFPLLVTAADGFEELVLMGSISILIAFLAAAEAVGVSIVIGAFAAGIAIRADDATALGVQNGIESIKDFFVAIFFVTIGALVQLPDLEVVVIATALTGVVLVLSPLFLMFAFFQEGYDPRTAFLASSNLTQVSEFSLVIAIQALLLETIAPAMFDAIILAAAATMILSVLLSRHEETVYETVLERLVRSPRTDRIDSQSSVDPSLSDHAVIVGFGRQGRLYADTLAEREIPHVVIENDPVILGDLERQCENYVMGDAMASYPLEKANLAAASVVFSTIDHERLSRRLLEVAPADTDVILRADSSTTATRLFERGATFVIVPNVLAGEQLIDTVDSVVRGETAADSLRAEHLEMLENLEQYTSDRHSESI